MVDLLVEFAPWRVHIYILPCCSTAAATVLNSAGDGAQFARSRCSISGGILILTEISCHIEINDRAEWFYQVIRKIKLIQFIAMMDANTRFQPMDYQIPCDSTPQNGITIIQCSIAGIVRASGKAPAKQCREINRSSRSLTIIMVIGKDTVRHLI